MRTRGKIIYEAFAVAVTVLFADGRNKDVWCFALYITEPNEVLGRDRVWAFSPKLLPLLEVQRGE